MATDTTRSVVGPNDFTVSDFWRMIWEQGSTRVIMLANFVEAGKVRKFTIKIATWYNEIFRTLARLHFPMFRNYTLQLFFLSMMELRARGGDELLKHNCFCK